MRSGVVFENAATVAPPTTPVLISLGGFPSPVPIISHSWIPVRPNVAEQLYIGIFVQIGVGMELPRDERVQLFRIWGVRKGQPRNVRVGGSSRSRGRGRQRSGILPDRESEVEVEFVFEV